ncbi:MAG: site-2 protease family protein [Gemmataceae bacterium]
MIDELPIETERRKQVRLRIRRDLVVTPQRYEGRTYYIIKDPVSLRYWRYREEEHFLIQLMDGTTTIEEAQKRYEERFRPDRLRLEHLEAFAQQLLNSGLAYHDAPHFGRQLYEQGCKRTRKEWLQTLTNILYIKIPVFDPDKLLERMLPWLRWIFTTWFMMFSLGLGLAAIYLVASHFETFRSRLPTFHEFFSFKNLIYLWIALGAVKIIHEFGHGLTCKAFGGEVHEMGLLFLCLSPCLYCNVSDSWTMPSKWRRIMIGFAGIYVELVIASLATFVWWNTSTHPFINNLSLSLMLVCSVSTVVFNANPLMRFDGYYILADWMEIPNLRIRSNQYLSRLAQEYCLGIEQQPEPHMDLNRRVLFVTYAIVSYVYRWFITFVILYMLYTFLKPYKLGAVGALLALAALASMIGWPLYRLGSNLHKRGRLPDMKRGRVALTASVVVALLLAFFFLPLPVSRVRETGVVQVVPSASAQVFVQVPGILEKLHVQNGQRVPAGYVLAEFRNLEIENSLEEARTQFGIAEAEMRAGKDQLALVSSDLDQGQARARIARAEGERDRYAANVRHYEKLKEELVLRSPRDGVVMGAPEIDAVGRRWDKTETAPFCTIAESKHLRVLMAVTASEYRLLREDRARAQQKGGDLPVDLRVQGCGPRIWHGTIVQLPEATAKTIPLPLSNRAGGPVQVQTGGTNPSDNELAPLSPCYLVAVAIDEPDGTIYPGTFAQVKVHCRWRTAAWWLWRTISATFDLGLM